MKAMIPGITILPSDINRYDNNKFSFTPKFNGMNVVIDEDGVARNKHGEPTTKRPLPPDVILQCVEKRACVNGEFDLRTGIFYPFDITKYEGEDLRNAPFHERYLNLLKFFREVFDHTHVSREILRWTKTGGEILGSYVLSMYRKEFGDLCEGAVIKRNNAPYVEGKSKSIIRCRYA